VHTNVAQIQPQQFCGSSGIRVGDFDSNLLKKLGLNSWFQRRNKGLGEPGAGRTGSSEMRSFSTPPRFSETPRPAARRRGEPALPPIGFGAPGLPETFLRNGSGRRTQTAGQRNERHCVEDATALVALVENSGMRSDTPLLHGEITSSIIASFFDIHGELGFGFRESLYARALERLLIEKGHTVDREVAVMIYCRGEPLADERMDMVVDGQVIIVFFENRFKHRTT
jgi:hypothetical protein